MSTEAHFRRRKERTKKGWEEIKDQGACYGKPWLTHLFFPRPGTSLDEVFDICHGNENADPCPILRQCLFMHLDEPFGIFGGVSENERERIRWHYKKTGVLLPPTRTVGARKRRSNIA